MLKQIENGQSIGFRFGSGLFSDTIEFSLAFNQQKSEHFGSEILYKNIAANMPFSDKIFPKFYK